MYFQFITSTFLSFSQPSADKVKEVTVFSKESLEKIEKSRIEGDYNEVDHTPVSFLPPNPLLMTVAMLSLTPSV